MMRRENSLGDARKNRPAIRSFLAAAGLVLAIESTDAAGETTVCGPIVGNATWTVASHPYLVTCSIIVPKHVTLTIEPGVEVRVRRRQSVIVEGTLVGQGTETEPIIFTSKADPPYPGDWGGISFAQGSSPARYDDQGRYRDGSVLRFAVVQFGGSSGRLGAIEILGAGPSLDHVVIQKNAASAVKVENGLVRITHSSLVENSNSQAFGSGVLSFSSDVTIEDSVISKSPTAGNGGGIQASDSVLTIRNSVLDQNETSGNGGGLFATDSTVTIEQSVFSANRSPVRGGALYAARSNVVIRNSAFEGNLTMENALRGASTEELRHLTRGAGIYVTASRLTVTHTTFTNNLSHVDCGALAAADSTLVLTGNVFIENGATGDGAALCLDGMVDGSSVTLNTIARNRSQPSGASGVISLQSGRFPPFSHNNIADNTGYDLANHTARAIEAAHNWWGSQDEGAIRARIYDRTRDGTKGEVLISPVLDQPATPPGPSAGR